jgi:hypothetical protein
MDREKCVKKRPLLIPGASRSGSALVILEGID